jgi:hypothetical protein
LIWDYIAVPSTCNYNYSFDTGQTYYVSSSTYFGANVAFNPNCCIKFNGNYLLMYGTITCNGTSANPSILTAWNDDLFGGWIQTETSCPSYSAQQALWEYYINSNVTIRGMRIRWANTAIRLDSNGCGTYTHNITNCSFEFCNVGIYANGCNVNISSSTRCGVVTPTSQGSCVKYSGSPTDICAGDSDFNGAQDITEYQYFGRVGSLPGNVVGGVSARTSSHSPSTGEVIWSMRDDANVVYQYNTNCWLYGAIGLSSFSPWHAQVGTQYSYQGGGTLITPRHAITITHMALPDNTPVRFVGTDNVAHQVICLHGERLVDVDYWVMVFDHDLPSNVAHTKILPSSAIHKFTPTMQNWMGPCWPSALLPTVGFNQIKEAYICDALFLDDHTYDAPAVTVEPSQWFSWWGSLCRRSSSCTCNNSDVTGGDSGSPTFLLINGELALIGPWSDCNYATWPGRYFSELNTAIGDLDTWVSNTYRTNAMTGYTATSFPLDSFPDLW